MPDPAWTLENVSTEPPWMTDPKGWRTTYQMLPEISNIGADMGPDQILHRIALGAVRHKIHSQQGEEGPITHILHRIGTKNANAWEIGSWDGIGISNTRLLWEHGWTVHLADTDAKQVQKIVDRAEDRVHPACAKVTGENIDSLLGELQCPPDADFGCLDIDGQEVHVMRGMVRTRPRLFMVECANTDHGDIPEVGGPGQAGGDVTIKVLREIGYTPVWRNLINILALRNDVLEAWEQGQR